MAKLLQGYGMVRLYMTSWQHCFKAMDSHMEMYGHAAIYSYIAVYSRIAMYIHIAIYSHIAMYSHAQWQIPCKNVACYGFIWLCDYHMQCCNQCLRERWKVSMNQITTQKEDLQQQDQEQAQDERHGTEKHPDIYGFIATLLEGYGMVRNRSRTNRNLQKTNTTNRKNITKNALFEGLRRRLHA